MFKKILPLFIGLLCVGCFSSSNSSNTSVDGSSQKIDWGMKLEDGKMTFDWEAVPEATEYDIFHAGSRQGEYIYLDTTSQLEYTHTYPNENKYENYYKIYARTGKTVLLEQIISLESKMFGDNIMFYNAKYDNMTNVYNEVEKVHNKMFQGQFSSSRYAFYFKPGQYRDFGTFNIGYYTSISGLGLTPGETKLYGSVKTPPPLSNDNATCTFWRSIENFEISSGSFNWAVSQAAPARRMKVNVSTNFDWNGGWASGGFASDINFNGWVGSYSQQQWYTRNSNFTQEMQGVNWNKVVQGSSGRLFNTSNDGSRTRIDSTPIIREKPFLYWDGEDYSVFVPGLREDAIGTSWTDTDPGIGYSLKLEDKFYIAKADVDNAASINNALKQGKHIFVTPGMYLLEEPIHIENANTIILGTGLASFIPNQDNNKGAIYIDDVDNVTVAGLMLDAHYSSKYLLKAGDYGASKDHQKNPTLLADLFFRVGGYKTTNTHTDVSAYINSKNVIGDHFWVWRADHGSGVGWFKNTAPYGLVVTGDDVTFYGLFVEHYQKYQTVWLGENGRTYFYQCETPYDPSSQSEYMSHNNTVKGWAGYKVGNDVENHLAMGMGVYDVFINAGANVQLDNAIEVPNKVNVIIRNANIVMLSSSGRGTNSIINGAGNGTRGSSTGNRQYISYYSDGQATTPSSKKTGTQPEDEIFDFIYLI